jgi:TRAP-type C4-dicarboxylate transport system substrate-binding protein
MHPSRFLVAAILFGTATAHAADPVVLRFATVVPDGTAWARELKAAARDVELQTNGQVRWKWYFGGIAGDESVVPERIRRGQLEGEAAGVSCVDMAPSLRVLRVLGMFRRRDEAHAIVMRLRPTLEAEFHRAGFELLAVQWFGSDIAVTRTPVHSLAELRKLRLWYWNIDTVWAKQLAQLGLTTVPLGVNEAGAAFDEGRIDGFLALPTAALAFQWSSRARYYTDLPLASMAACSIISRQAFDALPIEAQQILRTASTKASIRFEDINAAQEDQLLGGLFDKQGMHRVPADVPFREEFLDQAKAARDALPESLVPRALITRVLGWLSDFRAERPLPPAGAHARAAE